MLQVTIKQDRNKLLEYSYSMPDFFIIGKSHIRTFMFIRNIMCTLADQVQISTHNTKPGTKCVFE